MTTELEYIEKLGRQWQLGGGGYRWEVGQDGNRHEEMSQMLDIFQMDNQWGLEPSWLQKAREG